MRRAHFNGQAHGSHLTVGFGAMLSPQERPRRAQWEPAGPMWRAHFNIQVEGSHLTAGFGPIVGPVNVQGTLQGILGIQLADSGVTIERHIGCNYPKPYSFARLLSSSARRVLYYHAHCMFERTKHLLICIFEFENHCSHKRAP